MDSKHTPTPWMTSPCGALAPDDVMIVADFGRNENGIQQISTVAKALSIRQTKEVTAANAAFIVRCVNVHEELLAALKGLMDDTSEEALDVAKAAIKKAEAHA